MIEVFEKINPRDLIKDLDVPAGAEILGQYLKGRGGYSAQPKPLLALYNTIRRATSHLLNEGVRGGGKTAMALGLQKAFGLRFFHQQCMSGLKIADMLYEWDRTAQSIYVDQQTRNGVPLSEAQQEQWTLPFLTLGPILQAFVYAADPMNLFPPILLVDEVDKLDEVSEDILLQIFSDGFANIPRLLPDDRIGITPEISQARRQFKPIVILTSNNMRSGVSGPLRSRGRFTEIKASTFDERIQILATRVDGLPLPLLIDLAMFIKALEGKSFKEKPDNREFIELAETLVEYRIERVTEQVLVEQISTLAKCSKDLVTLTSAFEGICTEYINQPDKDVVDSATKHYEEAQRARNELKNVAAPKSTVSSTNFQPAGAGKPMYPRTLAQV